MKIYPVQKILNSKQGINFLLVHTGQHYDYNMNKLFFNDLHISPPDYYLNAKDESEAKTIANIIYKFDEILTIERPDLILVVGDVDSTLACAIASNKKGIKIAHIEAGLRSYDKIMPEEINRIITDQLSEYLFITEIQAEDNLLKEGIPKNKIHLVGNVMIDTLCSILPQIKVSKLILPETTNNKYITTTFHRIANVDNIEQLKQIIKILRAASEMIPIVFPIHPRTKKNLIKYGLYKDIKEINNIHIISPLGYIKFIKLLMHSEAIITDSGGIQSEAYFLGIPCLILRDKTEHQSTQLNSQNFLIPNLNLKTVLNKLKIALSSKDNNRNLIYNWDGNTAKRIVDIILNRQNIPN
ncbi:UNVERIFIED_CONTAM: hypothetical protein GTU68_032700 [Idotea baltica]|nr:hypothetical protein [Idotea baltica]